MELTARYHYCHLCYILGVPYVVTVTAKEEERHFPFFHDILPLSSPLLSSIRTAGLSEQLISLRLMTMEEDGGTTMMTTGPSMTAIS